ncbi:MAG: nucleotide sugar dehydrogenase [Rhodothermales bacterium]
MMKIAVVGTGYVGLSLGVLLAQQNEVVALDIDENRVQNLNQRRMPLKDPELEAFFYKKAINFNATIDQKTAYQNADFIIVATPTDFDEESGYFDTSSVESVIENALSINSKATIVIKSTIPIGFTEGIRRQYPENEIIFSPEFLREGRALYDNLHPSRIILGSESKNARIFARLLANAALNENITTQFTHPTEAEAIKLFSNAYLAARVAFFNELDTFAALKNLDASQIINGMCADDRIGNYYNNPSFGFGGYCFPKDTKQLLRNFDDVPQTMMSAIVSSNITRKQFIANDILRSGCQTVGVYKLAMKSKSDNFRFSAVKDIIDILKNNGLEILVYEPGLTSGKMEGCTIVSTLEQLKQDADLIIVNRVENEILDVSEKIYTRDVFGNN